MKTKLFFMLFAFAALFISSCTKYPPTSDRLLEDLVVLTQYDTKTDFNNYMTYAIAHSITKITDDGNEQLTGTTAEAILAQIDKNMQERGFVKVADNADPDFGVDVLYFQNTTVYTYYYDYWGWGGYYYPYYPYYPVYYASYTTGLVNIELLDLKNGNSTNGTPIRWNGFIRGLLTGYHTTAELTGAVDQAFIQTPQLQTSAK